MNALLATPAWGVTATIGPQPYAYSVQDIETGSASEEEIKAYFDATWRAPSNIKDPAKIAARRKEDLEKRIEKAALQPMAPVIAIGIKSVCIDGTPELRCLHCMKAHAPATRMGGYVEGFASATEMLQAYATLSNARMNEETVLVGFNIRDFDLPAVRRAIARLKLPMPGALLNPDQPLFDNMKKYLYMFCPEEDGIMLSAPKVSLGLGIEAHGLSGKMVPELHAAGEFEAVIDKVLLDVLEEEQQFLRMTGRS